MSKAKEIHEGLVSRVAKMGAHKHTLREAREQLIGRAREQLDSMGPAIATLEHAVDAGKGGIFTQRRLRTMLKERERLQRVIADHQERSDRERDEA